jgi:hypothetical protein
MVMEMNMTVEKAIEMYDKIKASYIKGETVVILEEDIEIK